MDLLDEACDIRKRRLIVPGWKAIWSNHFVQLCGQMLDVLLSPVTVFSHTLMGCLHDIGVQSHHLEE